MLHTDGAPQESGVLIPGQCQPHGAFIGRFGLFSLFPGCYGWLFFAVIVPPRLPEGQHFCGCAGLLAVKSCI